MARVNLITRKTLVAINQTKYHVSVRPAATGGSTSVVNDGYVHTQASASDTWVVNHNLGRFVQADVFSPGGLLMDASVTNVSTNQVVVNFNTPQSGYAVVN